MTRMFSRNLLIAISLMLFSVWELGIPSPSTSAGNQPATSSHKEVAKKGQPAQRPTAEVVEKEVRKRQKQHRLSPEMMDIVRAQDEKSAMSF
jgi:hypothetical protein